MNVLMYVMMMLMLLAILTYARLETYRDSATTQVLFKYYMEKLERNYANGREVENYNAMHVLKRRKGNKEKASQALSRLSFYPFINKEAREENPAKAQETITLAKKLLVILYGQHAFFQEMEKKRSDFLNELFVQLMDAADKFSEKNKITHVTDLSNFHLSDRDLNDVFYLMLKGTLNEEQALERPSEEVEESQITQTEEDLVVVEDLTKLPMLRLSTSYPSLYDYITIKNSTGIRVYLAPRALLAAIYDESTADTIIDYRQNLYKLVISKTMDAQAATTNFQNQFGSIQTGLSEGSLNFSVTKTDPKLYE